MSYTKWREVQLSVVTSCCPTGLTGKGTEIDELADKEQDDAVNALCNWL